MIIDPATNLPELPEGYLWYIGQHSVSIVTPAEDTKWLSFDMKYPKPLGTLETRVVTKTILVTKTRQEPTVKFLFFHGTKTVEYQAEERVEVTEYRYVNRLGTVTRAYTEIKDTSEYTATYYKITEADVLPLCVEAFQNFNEKRQSEEELERLVGLYPPKKFEVNS